MSKPSQERAKVVVRNLPPTLAEEAFQSTIDKVAEGTYNWLAYYPGKVSLKRTVFSRAFINFNTSDAVVDFKNKFDGHVFISTRGTQYKCSVEYAIFQRVPTAHPRKLAMEGTIEKDIQYQAFLKTLEEGPKAVPTAQAQAQEAARSAEASAPVVTALMAFLQKKYESTPFTGRRGGRAARSREGAKLASLLEEESDASKAVKGRSKSTRSSRATSEGEAATTAAAVAAATAAASGAATHAVRSGKQKHSKPTSKQQDVVASEHALKDRKPGKSGGVAAAASAGEKALKQKPKHGRQAAAAADSADEASTIAAVKEQGEDAKHAAAAALAAASAANAAAAARKSRVKAGHQVYTPGARAGGRLFAAALPKSSADDAVSAGREDAGRSTAVQVPTAVTDAGGSKHINKEAAANCMRQATSAAEGSTSKPRGPSGKKVAVASSAARAAAMAAPDDVRAGIIGVSATSEACSLTGAAGAADDGSTRGAKGGRGRSRSSSSGRQQPQQQIWLPKPGGAG